MHLARAKFRSVCAEETPLDRARWDIVESSLARVGEIGCGTDLELDQLRARASLLREVEILDAEGLARWQRSLEGLGAIWVVAPFFVNDEEECLLDAVVHNLRRGVRYTFLLYPESRAEFESLLTNLQVRIGAEGDLATAALAGASPIWRRKRRCAPTSRRPPDPSSSLRPSSRGSTPTI